MKKQEKKYNDDELKILENFKKISVEQKMLFCLYFIIILLVVQILLQIFIPATYKNNSDSNMDLVSNGQYDISEFEEIFADDLKQVQNDSNIQVLYLGKSTCEYCIQFIPVLKKAQKEYKYKTKYINIEALTDEGKETILSFDNEDGFIKSSFGSTPMVLTVKDGKLVQGWVGYGSYEDFEEFLKMSGIKK